MSLLGINVALLSVRISHATISTVTIYWQKRDGTMKCLKRMYKPIGPGIAVISLMIISTAAQAEHIKSPPVSLEGSYAIKSTILGEKVKTKARL